MPLFLQGAVDGLWCRRSAFSRRLSAAVLVGIVLISPALASDAKIDRTGNFAIRWWTVEDGLAAMPLVGVAVAADDAVWCATRSHVMRFDGRRFATLPDSVGSGLRGRLGDFARLGVSPDGRLWLVGTTGVASARPPDEVELCSLADWEVCPYAAGTFWGLCFSPQGLPLFYGLNMLVDGEGKKLVPRVLPELDPGFAFYGAVIDQRSADLWLWGYGKARRVRDEVAHADDGPLAGRIINLASGRAGIWAGLVDLPTRSVDGAAVFREGEWHEYPMTRKPAAAAREGHICEGPDGTVWLATHASMHALREGNWQTVVEGLPGFSLTTQRLTTDRHGTLWAACKGGLLSIGRTSLRRAPLADCQVMFVRRDGSLVAGVAGAVVRPDPAVGSGRHDVIAELPPGVSPTAITETADGTLFIGTRDSFVYVVQGGTARMVTQAAGSPFEARNISSLACDTAGQVWAGTMNGLARYDPSHDCFGFVDAFSTPAPVPVLGLLAESDGSLLVAAQGRGVERLAADGSVSQEVPATLVPGRRFVRFLRGADQTLWLAGDGGLLRRDPTGQTTNFDTRHGLVEQCIVQMAADGSGRLWLAMRDGHLQGIRTVDLDTAAAGQRGFVRGIVLGPLDGLGEMELLGGLVASPAHGLLATTSGGLVTVDPERLVPRDSEGARPISIGYAMIDGQSRFQWADVTTHEWDLPIYQTRLVGVDAAWSPPSGDTARTYAGIPPGRHRFEVRHLRGDAVEDAPFGAVEIVIPVPFWKTPWFLAGAIVAVASLAAAGGTAVSRGLARRRIAQLEREQERHRDRARIARDIHDSLGAGLAQMAMLSDVMRRSMEREPPSGAANPPPLDEALDEMFRSAQGLTRAVDEIVWAVNPANDTLQRLFTFLAHDVEDMARNGDLELRIRVDEDLPNVVLPAAMRHHLCMLVREAVANVLKHAQATVLEVVIACRNDAIEITIGDDGEGFTPSAPLADGHDGLSNMRARVDELGGSLTIDSSPGMGTRVAIQTPLPASTAGSPPGLRLRLVGDDPAAARRARA